MAINDSYWKWVAAGSTATSAATAHNVFGNYGGLSSLNANEVVVAYVWASGADLRLSCAPNVQATDDIGLFVSMGASIVKLPPMIRNDASQITFAREVPGTNNNPVAQWVVWRRVAG